ncbi:MAG: VOC family protein [Pseudomonadota bacterium]
MTTPPDRKSQRLLQRSSLRRRDSLKLGVGVALTVGLTGYSQMRASALDTDEADTEAGMEASMEKVTGIGGFFFRAENPDELSNWYKTNLGIDLAPQKSGGLPWRQETGYTVFDPFEMSNEMIPEGKSWMINFRVSDLSKMVEQLRRNGNEVSDVEDYPHGRFAELTDPEGNGIQLWQPAG